MSWNTPLKIVTVALSLSCLGVSAPAKKKSAKKRAYNPTTYIKNQAVEAAVEGADTSQPVAAAAPVVSTTITCMPEEPPKPCEPGDANCEKTEVQPTQPGAVGNVPAGDDMAKTIFKKVRERCKPDGDDGKSFEPVVGLSIEPPTEAEASMGAAESGPSRIMNIGRRVGATVGFKAEF